MGKRDDLDAFIAARKARNPDFPGLLQAELDTLQWVRELAAGREPQDLSQERVEAAQGTNQRNVARAERGGVDPKHGSLVRYPCLLGRRVTPEPLELASAQQLGDERSTHASPLG